MPKKKKDEKIWTTPLLTVLVKGKPEERALAACKITGEGPEGSNAACETLCGTDCELSVGS